MNSGIELSYLNSSSFQKELTNMLDEFEIL